MGNKRYPSIEDVDIPVILEGYLNHQFFFDLKDITDNFICEYTEAEVLEYIQKDPRFFVVSEPSTGYLQIISDRALFNYYSKIIIRHLNIHSKLTISRKHLLQKLYSILLHPHFKDVPEKIITYGKEYGFLISTVGGEFFLPMIMALSPHYNPLHILFVRNFFNLLRDLPKEKRYEIIKRPDKVWLQQIFNQFKQNSWTDDRLFEIISKRCGLVDGRIYTLQEIGDNYHVSRERIRQIEGRFWHKFYHPRDQEVFINFLISHIMNTQGSVIFDESCQILLALLIKNTSFPLRKIPLTDIYLTKNDQIDLDFIREILDDKGAFYKKQEILNILENRLPFCHTDLERIADQIICYRDRSLKKSDRVIIALSSLGKPSHYSVVFDRFCELFPDIEISEHSVHAILGRLSTEGRDVVWIGIRGTYALNKWGYERPELGLYDIVTKIVRDHYEKTGKPISLNKIKIEINKYRQVINENSLLMSITFNEEITRVSKDHFIPVFNHSSNKEDPSSLDIKVHNGLERFLKKKQDQDNKSKN